MSQGFTKGTPIDTDGALSLNSDIVVPSQAAVVTYVASQIGTNDLAVLAVTETAARLDDWAPTGWPGTTSRIKVIQLTANYVDKVQIISGLVNGTAGRIVTLSNVSTDNLIILELNSTSSSAANRFKFLGRGAYFLFPGDDITLLHNGTQWSQLSGSTTNGHMAFDDMLGAVNAPAPTVNFGEAAYGSASGTGAILRNEDQILNGIGTINLTTGTTASGNSTLKAMSRSGFYLTAGIASKYCIVSRFRLNQLPTAAQDFTFAVGISTQSNVGGITVSGSNSWYASFANGFWRNYTSNTANTLISDTTTTLPVTTNAIVLGTYHPNNMGDTVFFYSADGGMTYAVSSRFVRVSNNYGGAPVIGVNKLVGTTSIAATIDYVGISCKGGII